MLVSPRSSDVMEILSANWRHGYTVPHGERYPWQWLWDSCFHSVVWNWLGLPVRGLEELDEALRLGSADGFIPHIRYHGGSPHSAFWGRTSTSSITQPPMFGHALAEMWRSGFDIPFDTLERARHAFRFLIERRHRLDGLLTVVHPWETGADDSPRWDHWYPGGFDRRRGFDVKGHLMRHIRFSECGSPVANPSFQVAPVGFNALVAFNALELSEVLDDDDLAGHGNAIVKSLESRWDSSRRTWVDAGESEHTSGDVRTLDALLPALVCDSQRAEAALGETVDQAAFGALYGLLGVHRAEAAFEPGSYWRGGTWPQLCYLLWRAAQRQGQQPVASELASSTWLGASNSGFAEYWDGDSGEGRGAAPQSWATLAAVMAVRIV